MSRGQSFRAGESYSPEIPLLLWKYSTSHALTSEATPMICRDNNIIYTCLNTIRTWNYKSNEEKIRYFALQNEDSITALAELPNKSLIWGSKSGYVHIEKDGTWANFRVGESAVDEISVLGPGHAIVKLGDKKKTIISTDSGTKLRDFDDMTEVCRYKENIFALVKNSDIEIGNVDNKEKSSKLENYFRKKFSSIRAELDQLLLLKHADKSGFTIWCVEKNVFSQARLNGHIWTDQFKNLVFFDSNTFFIPEFESKTKRMCLTKYTYDASTKRWSPHVRTYAGHGSVLCMTRSGNYLIYGTMKLGKSFASGIHVFNRDCELLYSDSKCTDNGVSNYLALVPLKNGSFAIRLSDSVRIIKKQNYPKYKSRLFVGEGDFSFTEALIRKHELNHPRLGEAITATELNDVEDYVEERRIQYLRYKGVEIRCGIDAQNLHHEFPRFKRIHWNCPFGNQPKIKDFDFANVIREFFEACSKNQKPGDRVHVTLMQEKSGDWWKRFRQQDHPIVSASSYAGYSLNKKRVFGEKRYPGYQHWKTSGMDKHSTSDEDMREFVFEKVNLGLEYTAEKPHEIKKYRPRDSEYYFDCSTDCDSSSYEDSSSDDDADTMIRHSQELSTNECMNLRDYFDYNKLKPISSRTLTVGKMSVPSPDPKIGMRPIPKSTLTERHTSNPTLCPNIGITPGSKPVLSEDPISNPTLSPKIEMRSDLKPTLTRGHTSNFTLSPNIRMRPSPSPTLTQGCSSTEMRPSPEQTITENLESNPTLSANVGVRPGAKQTLIGGQISNPSLSPSIGIMSTNNPSQILTKQNVREPLWLHNNHSRQSRTYQNPTSGRIFVRDFESMRANAPQQAMRSARETEEITRDLSPLSKQARLR